jgi:hypothetical protein
MIKLKDLLNLQESVITEQLENLPAVEFADNFVNNYITLTGDWKQKADLVISQIQDAINQGKDLKSLTVKINGGASNVPATNIWDDRKMSNPPNHNFKTIGQTKGGLLPDQGWVRKSDNELALDKKPIPGGRSGAGVNITPADKGLTGNKWLANARANSLRNALVPYISGKLGVKFTNIEVSAKPVTPESIKSAHAVVRSAVIPGNPPPNYKYIIQYPWYKVGNQSNMVLVDGNIAAGWRQNKPGTMSTKWYRSTIADKNILYSGFQKDGQAGRGMHAYAFIKLNAAAYRGSFALYRDEKSWLADVKKMTQYAPGLSVGELRSGDPNSKEILPGYRGAEGYLDKTGSSKYTGFAEFQMKSKDYIVSNGDSYYLFKPQGDQANYITDLFPAKGANAPADGAVDSKGNRSRIRGSQYSAENPNAITYSGVTTIETFS